MEKGNLREVPSHDPGGRSPRPGRGQRRSRLPRARPSSRRGQRSPASGRVAPTCVHTAAFSPSALSSACRWFRAHPAPNALPVTGNLGEGPVAGEVRQTWWGQGHARPAQRGRQGSGWQGCGPGPTSSHARQLSPRAPGEVAVAKDTTPRTGDLAKQLRPGAWRPSPHVLELKPPAGSAVVTGAPPRPRMGALEALQRPKASSAQPEPSSSRAQAKRGSDTPRGRPELGLLQRAGAGGSLPERDGDGDGRGGPWAGGGRGSSPPAALAGAGAALRSGHAPPPSPPPPCHELPWCP